LDGLAASDEAAVLESVAAFEGAAVLFEGAAVLFEGAAAVFGDVPDAFRGAAPSAADANGVSRPPAAATTPSPATPSPAAFNSSRRFMEQASLMVFVSLSKCTESLP
jgi:hypothetical protein